MTHDQIVKEIQKRAKARHVRTHYCGHAERCSGDAGQPDLFLCGVASIAWIEVKTAGDRLKPAQTAWRYALLANSQVYEVMGEADLEPGGAIDTLLDVLTFGQPVLFGAA